MNEILSLLLGLCSGFIAGIATGGGLLNIPGLIMLGLPPSVAIATNNLTLSSSITSAFRYNKSRKIDLHQILPFVLISFVGSIAGSKLLLQIDVAVMQKAFGVVCICLATLFAFSKAATSNASSRRYQILGYAGMFLASMFAALFGTGGGFFTVYILSYFFAMGTIEANANSKIISLGGALATLLVFVPAGIINFRLGVPLMIGSAIGGYIGAHTAIKKGDAKVKIIFTAIVLISGIKLILS